MSVTLQNLLDRGWYPSGVSNYTDKARMIRIVPTRDGCGWKVQPDDMPVTRHDSLYDAVRQAGSIALADGGWLAQWPKARAAAAE